MMGRNPDGSRNWTTTLFAAIAAVALFLAGFVIFWWLAEEQSEPPLTVAPPAWMDQVTSACDEFGVRIYAYNGVPFAATRGTCEVVTT